MVNPLRYCLTGESAEIVDRILGPFLQECDGKNDLAVVNGLLASAAILIVTHCERTGESVQELANLNRQIFDLAVTVANDEAPPLGG